jgi:hypothetical protein
MLSKRIRNSWGLLPFLAAGSLRAEPIDPSTPFDRSPYISARAAGMSQAISPVANGMESAFYNPALIGGLYKKPSSPLLTHLYFPYLGAAYGESSARLQKELNAGRDLNDSSVSSEMLRAFDGDHPYARLSITPAVIVSKLFVAYTSDTRASSMPDPDQPDHMLINVRKSSGPILGFSAADPKGQVHLGVTAGLIHRTDVQGSFSLPDVNGVPERKSSFAAAEKNYDGIPVNVGLQWNGPTMLHPAVSAVVRNAGSTPYENKNGDQRITDQEDVTIGLGLSPHLGSYGMFHLVLEGTQLSDKTLPAEEKFRAGTEITLGNRFGGEAGLGLRAGYSVAGISYGIGLHLGILTLEAASFAEDIGAGPARVVERRNVINIGINVADY